MRNPFFISALVLLCAPPLVLCVIFWALPLGSVGPMIPITGIVNVLGLPILIFKGVAEVFEVKRWKPALAVVSLISGVLLAVLGMNLFIGLTALFGIMDYQLM